MLSRIALRSNAAVRSSRTTSLLRTYATQPKKPTASTSRSAAKPKSPVNASKKGAVARSAAAAANTTRGSITAKETGEHNVKAKPQSNTAPTEQPGPRATPIDGANKTSQKESVEEAETFGGPHDPAANTAPRSSPTQPEPQSSAQELPEDIPPAQDAKNSAAQDANDPAASSKPLPDLRQGIPSTFAQEFASKSSQSSQSSKSSKSSSAPQQDPENITEDGSDDPQSSRASGSGGSRSGELPRSAYETSGDRMRNRIANWTYVSFVLFGLTGAAYLGRPWDNEAEAATHPDIPDGWSAKSMYDRARARLGSQMGYYTEPNFPKLLPDIDPSLKPPYTLVLSLEDMLVHSEWTREHGWRTAKRPGVDYFLRYLSQYYELVIFTSLPSQAADQVIRKLDPYQIVMWPLFREATRYEKGQYIKDLTYLNRDLKKTLLIDTVDAHARNQPENAIILPKWTGDPKDRTLVSLVPFLEYIAAMSVEDVRTVLKSFEGKSIPEEFLRREGLARAAHNQKLREEESHKPRHSAPAGLLGALGMKPQPGQHGAMVMEGGLGAADRRKFIGDVIRERGMKNYEFLESQIQKEGEKWLQEQKEMEKKMMEEQMKSGKKWVGSLFGRDDAGAAGAASAGGAPSVQSVAAAATTGT